MRTLHFAKSCAVLEKQKFLHRDITISHANSGECKVLEDDFSPWLFSAIMERKSNLILQWYGPCGTSSWLPCRILRGAGGSVFNWGFLFKVSVQIYRIHPKNEHTNCQIKRTKYTCTKNWVKEAFRSTGISVVILNTVYYLIE